MLPVQKAIIREIRRLHARRAPLNIPAVKRSQPKLLERVYKVRPFWGWRRALEAAGLDYSKINVELHDYVECEICGKDLGALHFHLVNRHQVTADDYRLDYPDAPLVCETVRARMSRLLSRPNKDTLPHWEALWSPEYVLDRMAELHRQKYRMNYNSVTLHDPRLPLYAVIYFGSWDKALRRIGLDPSQIRLTPPSWPDKRPWFRADKAAIIAELHRRKAVGETVSETKIVHQKYGPAFTWRARRLFGSWANALIAAGLEPFGGNRSPWRKATRAEIVAEIHRRVQAGEPFRVKQLTKERWGHPILRRATVLFGSWSGALIAADIVPKSGKSPWPGASKAEVLAELRRRKRAGQTLRFAKIEREHWGRGLRQRCEYFFGSWAAAQRAVGVEPVVWGSPWTQAGKTAVLAEIRRRNLAGESMRRSRMFAAKMGGPLLIRAEKLFGGWGPALLAAGVDLPRYSVSPWGKADKAAIVAEIRRRRRAGETMRVGSIIKEQWGDALWHRMKKLFGSWGNALRAAGYCCDSRGAFIEKDP